MEMELQGNMKEVEIHIRNGIIGHPTRVCRWNAHGHDVVEATSGSFEVTTAGESVPAKDAGDLKCCSSFWSVGRTMTVSAMISRIAEPSRLTPKFVGAMDFAGRTDPT
jgi:hypothetical protein